MSTEEIVEVKLSQNKIAIIDKSDFEKVGKYNWSALKYKNGYYAGRMFANGPKKRKMIYMHRFILDLTNKNDHTDHINMNGLDNRRTNLRVCNNTQNQYNVKLTLRNKSGYKGVSWNRNGQRWVVHINYKGNRVFIGYYDNIIDAAIAYDKAAFRYHGEFANTNILRVAA